jgi:hypothetical protein
MLSNTKAEYEYKARIKSLRVKAYTEKISFVDLCQLLKLPYHSTMTMLSTARIKEERLQKLERYMDKIISERKEEEIKALREQLEALQS